MALDVTFHEDIVGWDAVVFAEAQYQKYEVRFENFAISESD